MLFGFAWVEPSETTFLPAYEREDEEVIWFSLVHEEGDFAMMEVEVRNPRVPPLSVGRKIHAWLSIEETPSAGYTPICFARLVGVPSNLIGDRVTYSFLARPSDFETQKRAVADAKRVLPFYDELFIDPNYQDDPDAALEGYSEKVHIDRITHVVSTSDMLDGEDGVITFDPTIEPEAVLNDTLDVRLAHVPVNAVTVKAEVPWQQSTSGSFNIGPVVMDNICMADSWPKIGDVLAGGYIVTGSRADQYSSFTQFNHDFQYQNNEKKHRDGDLLTYSEQESGMTGASGAYGYRENTWKIVGDRHTGTGAQVHISRSMMQIAFGRFTGFLTLSVSAGVDRKDAVEINLVSDIQPIIDDPTDDASPPIIELNTNDAAVECGEEEAPIGNAARAEYVSTDRGLQSIEYMIARGRKQLIEGSRCVSVSWECSLNKALDLSCRKNAYIIHDAIPGGEAVGKIVAYSMRCNGETGEARGSVKIMCAIGFDNPVTIAPGEADYVDEDYVDDYQTFTGQVLAHPAGDISYSPPDKISGGGGAVPNLGGSDCIIRSQVVVADAEPIDIPSVTISNFKDLLGTYAETQRRLASALAARQVHLELELVDWTNKATEAQWVVNTMPLQLPRQIDLTAGSSE